MDVLRRDDDWVKMYGIVLEVAGARQKVMSRHGKRLWTLKTE